MLGTNPTRAQDLDPEGALRVQEIFATIQGEGPYAGEPCVFVRLAGCNLRCWFCDTDFESAMKTPPLSAAQVLDAVQREGAAKVPESIMVVLTGGEPFRQNIAPFLSLLDEEGWWAQIETAGTIWVPGTHELVTGGAVEIVCSPKTPKIHPAIEEHCVNYKYIVSASMPIDPEQGVPMFYTQPSNQRVHPYPELNERLFYPSDALANIWLQPCDELDKTKNRLNRNLCAELAMRFGHRVSLQLHKVMGLK